MSILKDKQDKIKEIKELFDNIDLKPGDEQDQALFRALLVSLHHTWQGRSQILAAEKHKELNEELNNIMSSDNPAKLFKQYEEKAKQAPIPTNK